jgi:fatty-acyl-CoA synthase
MSGEMSVGNWLAAQAERTSWRVAIDFAGRAITYGDLDRAATGLAADLSGSGLERGDRVAVLSGNRPEYVTTVFAAARAGLIVVPLNWRLSSYELAYQLDDSQASLLIVEPDRTNQAREALRLAAVEPALRSIDTEVMDRQNAPLGAADDDPLFLVYTSGTTGRPKGALLTHANCFWTNLSLDRVIDVTTFDVVLQVLPQFHIGGWNVQPLLAWWKGATVVLEPDFEPGRALELIERKRVTTMMGVPATYLFMAEHPGFATADLSSLRVAVVGGAPIPEALIHTWQHRGVHLVQGYGLTEAAPNVLGLPPEDAARKVGYAGKPYPHVSVALRGLEGEELIDGPGTGELLVRGPNVFPGYWRNPEATAETLRRGWLHTGDVAERDGEGYYRIKDRVKDMYISGGENVYPAEVESVLHDLPAVVEAAVIGVPDDRWGEVGAAFVVLRPGSTVTAEELISFCGERLASFKVPRTIRFLDALPRSGMNKVLKTELAESLLEETRK